jgi:hypothetical protein
VRIPTDVGELTPEWFSEVLATEVRRVEVVDRHSGTTGRAKVRLDSAGALPDTLFCKLAPFDPRQRAFVQFTGLGVMEARFYASLAAELPVRLPKCWYAATEGDDYIMVLEDLDASGCAFRSDPQSTVEELAHLHAAFWESDRFDGDLAWVPERAGFGKSDGKDPAAAAAAGHFIHVALDQFAHEMPPVFRAIGELYAARTAEILDLWDEGERTFIHGDPHNGNLFSDSGRTGFYDWAMCSHSPGMRDVAYYLTNSMPTEARHADEGHLLDHYRHTLAGHGITLDPALTAKQYRLFAVFSWVSFTSTAAVGSRWQPSDRAIEAMERATRAVEDCDSIGLLKELLG